MKRLSSRKTQRGYLLEVPLILAAVAMVVTIVLPALPPIGQKILLGVASVPVLFALFYMIVIPGWTPDTRGRLKPPWNWFVFILVAALIITVVLAFAFSD
jgi:hypothetical protein